MKAGSVALIAVVSFAAGCLAMRIHDERQYDGEAARCDEQTKAAHARCGTR